MTLIKIIKQRTGLFIAAIIIAIVAVGIFTFNTTTKVNAFPDHEVEHFYYSDATYTNQVGYRHVTCYGVFTEGQVTQYVFTVDYEGC